MENWDAEIERWFGTNIDPLVDGARAKFAESEKLGKEAAKIFDEAPRQMIIKTKPSNFPPPLKS